MTLGAAGVNSTRAPGQFMNLEIGMYACKSVHAL